MRKLLALIIFAVAGCTDAERAALGALGEESEIKCYSGAEIIFDDWSTGKIVVVEHGGLVFRSKTTGKFVRAYADCVVMSN
jgi:hypothetical protein